MFKNIKPLKKTLRIDACHSGEIDKKKIEPALIDFKEETDVQFRLAGNTVTPRLGSQNTSKLTKSLLTDLRKGTEATVISSSGGMEFAIKGDSRNNGFFAYCFINGIMPGATI